MYNPSFGLGAYPIQRISADDSDYQGNSELRFFGENQGRDESHAFEHEKRRRRSGLGRLYEPKILRTNLQKIPIYTANARIIKKADVSARFFV